MPGTAHASQQRRAPKSNPKHQGTTGCRSLQGLFQYCQLGPGGTAEHSWGTRGYKRGGKGRLVDPFSSLPTAPYQSKARLLQRLSKLRILPLWGQKNTPTSHPNRCSLRSVPSWPLQQSISTAQKTPTRRTKRTSLTASAAEKQKNKQQLPLLPQTAHNSRVKRRLNKRLHRLSTKGSDLSYAVKRHCKTPGLLCKERLELKCQLSKKNK